MNEERWQRIQHLFTEALAVPATQRPDHVRRAAGTDETLAREVLSLLWQDARDDAVIYRVIDTAAADVLVTRAAPLVGRRLGAWQLVRHVADGGMGAVYEAQRADGRYQQRAAIKLLNPALMSPSAQARLEAERQILARLNHPNIARLLDGGSTDDGAPYLVMDYIDGVPIDDYCNTQGLDTPARLALFRRVCDAVDYAHKNLVVHRDLKPSNILVDQDGTPKLLDFGIAKLLDDAVPAVTRADQRVLTLAHASPEQLRGEAITTAADVYALGVLLYEVLCGRLPYHTEGKTSAEIARQILEVEPERPSSAVTHPGSARFAVRGEGLTAARLRRELEGDLDTIVLAALRKEPARRYGSVQALSDDLAGYLNDEPVSARPDTLVYRARKFVRRHRVGVTTTAAVLVAAAALVAFYTWQLALERDRAQRSAERAQVAAARAEKVAAFLAGVFDVADPTKSLGKTVTARELLDNGARQIERELAAEPAVQAALMEAMGSAYRSLGLYPEARTLQQKTLDARLALLGPEHEEVARSLAELGGVLGDLGDFDAAVAHLQRALSILRARAPPAPLAVARALRALAGVQRERGKDYAEAERTVAEAIEITQGLGAAGDAERARAMDDLGSLLLFTGKLAQARPWLEQARALRTQLYGEAHPETIASIRNVAQLLWSETRHNEAVPVIEHALALAREIYGVDHISTAYIASNLGSVLMGAGRYAESEKVLAEALAVFRRRLGDAHPRTAFLTGNLGNAIFYQGRYEEALVLYRANLEQVRGIFGEAHAEHGLSLSNLGGGYLRLEQYREAADVCRRADGVLQEAFGPGHPLVVSNLAKLGSALTGLRQFDAAEAALQQAQERAQLALPANHSYRAFVLNTRGWLMLARNRPREAEPLFRASLKIIAANHPQGGPRVALEQAGLGESLARLKRYPEAEPLLLDSHTTLLAALGERHDDVRAARRRLAGLYSGWGRVDQAARYRAAPGS